MGHTRSEVLIQSYSRAGLTIASGGLQMPRRNFLCTHQSFNILMIETARASDRMAGWDVDSHPNRESDGETGFLFLGHRIFF